MSTTPDQLAPINYTNRIHIKQDLVGKNLTALSQLDGLTFELYAGAALPRLLEQVAGCRDEIAQTYLMQVSDLDCDLRLILTAF